MQQGYRNYSLKQNPRGIWEIRFSEPAVGGGWRSRAYSTRTPDRNHAETVLKAFIATTTASDGQDRISGLLDAYERKLKAKKGALALTDILTLRVLRKQFGNLTPAQLTPAVIEFWRAEHPMKDGTARRYLAILIACFNHAVRQRLLPVGDKPHIDLPPNSEPRLTFLASDEERRFHELALADSTGELSPTRLTLFVALALNTGARRAAIETLTWDRVDLVNRRIDYRDPSMQVSKKRRVAVPVNDRLLPVLEWAKRTATTNYVLGSPHPIGHEFKKFTQRHGMDHVTPNVLRHTVATLLAQRGVSMFDIAGLLGNSPVVCARNYAHHSPEYLKGAAAMLG